MHSSATPENDPEIVGKQGPANWALETPSDNLLSVEVRQRLKEAFERWQAERDEPGP